MSAPIKTARALLLLVLLLLGGAAVAAEAVLSIALSRRKRASAGRSIHRQVGAQTVDWVERQRRDLTRAGYLRATTRSRARSRRTDQVTLREGKPARLTFLVSP